MEYTREKLIEICEKSIVPHEKWRDRDTAVSQEWVGKAWAFLKAGASFEIESGTNDRTIWIRITVNGFDAFEGGDPQTESFYLPTEARLERANGEDWY